METEMIQIADWMCDILDNMGDEGVVERVCVDVKSLCSKYPVYG